MARLTEVDVDYISLVKKGANKQHIQIYKSDDELEKRIVELIEEILKRETSKVVKEVVEPLYEKIEKMEKLRGISNQLGYEDYEKIEKSGSIFSGLDI